MLGAFVVILIATIVLQLTGIIHININASKVKVLDLSNKKLGTVPTYVFDDINLEELNISNNQITVAIQSEVRNLTKLRILNASNNLMAAVPAEIGQLQNLETLDL